MTLNEAAYNVLNQLRGGRSSNNEYFSLSQIKFWIGQYRALLIRRDEQALSRIDELTQQIDVPLDANETWSTQEGVDIPVMGANVPADAAASTDIIPKIVRLKMRPAIQSVYIDDSLVEIPVVDSRRVLWHQYDKYTSDARRAFLLNDRLYVTNYDTSTGSPQVQLRAIFEDPEEAFNFGRTSNFWDDDENGYPISFDLLQQVTQSIMSGEANAMLQTPSDQTADNQPDS